MKRILYLCLFFFIIPSLSSSAQQTSDSLHQVIPGDTATLWQAIKKGNITAQGRYYFMTTNNQDSLTDYWAHAAGGKIKYQSARFKHFDFGLSFSFAGNIASPDLVTPDPTTNQLNRYESGLFDVTDLTKKSVVRMDELYLTYNTGKGSFIAGRQIINTPFINTQDGRMNVTSVEAIWADFKLEDMHLQGGFINRIAPRSTGGWYDIHESIGLYPVGFNPDGTKSGYINNLSGSSIILFGLSRKIKPRIDIEFWNQYVDNIFNTTLAEVKWKKKSENNELLAALQFIHQFQLNKGGNEDPAKAYFHNASNTFSSKLQWKKGIFESSLSYTHIFNGGRFLMPREWGKEPLYTFMPRERNEGLGNSDALVAKLSAATGIGLNASIQAGYFFLPGIENTAENKYAMPSYNQINAGLNYRNDKLLKGADIHILYVMKHTTGNKSYPASVVFNKVNMSLLNLVFNYQF